MSVSTPKNHLEDDRNLQQKFRDGAVAGAAVAARPGDEPLQEPPPEDFWEKFSPRHEFPISTIATIAIHVVVVAVVIYVVMKLTKLDEKTPVPIRSVTVAASSSSGDGGGEAGVGGGDGNVEAGEDRPQEKQREIPQAELTKRIDETRSWNLDIKDPKALESIAESPAFDKLGKVNDQIKKRIAKGFNEKQGDGNAGAGTANEGKGSGSGGSGPPANSSPARSNRWVITFKTSNGEDYLRQLAAFDAKIVIPEPPDWEKNRLFENIANPGEAGKLLRSQDELPEMRFIDDNKGSAQRIARALKLNYSPPYFIAFFPKKVEDELAAKEREYRGREEAQIRVTTFSVIERNGQYEIKVTDQQARRK